MIFLVGWHEFPRALANSIWNSYLWRCLLHHRTISLHQIRPIRRPNSNFLESHHKEATLGRENPYLRPWTSKMGMHSLWSWWLFTRASMAWGWRAPFGVAGGFPQLGLVQYSGFLFAAPNAEQDLAWSFTSSCPLKIRTSYKDLFLSASFSP